MKIVTLLPFDMREVCKVLPVTPLRSSIIVHKLEILPKNYQVSCHCFNTTHSEAKKSRQQEREKRSHLWDVLYSEHTFCHQSGCFQLLDAIKALDNDCRSLRHLLLFSQRHLGVSRHSLPLIATVSSATPRCLNTVSNELGRGALRQPQMLKGSDLWGDPQPEKTQRLLSGCFPGCVTGFGPGFL